LNPGGGSGREEPPLGIQIPDDARELDRDLLAYRREQRVQRRRSRLRKLTAPFGGTSTVMPLLASILAVCLVAGAMLSVATFGPSTSANKTRPSAGATAAATKTTAAATGSPAATAASSHSAAAASTRATATGSTPSGTTPSGTTAAGASPAGVRPAASAGAPQPTPARHAVSSAAP
jgi:hypothetical protein